ncbi:MAG: hypothetical protein QXD64_08755 [Thermoplasmata archaeon]
MKNEEDEKDGIGKVQKNARRIGRGKFIIILTVVVLLLVHLVIIPIWVWITTPQENFSLPPTVGGSLECVYIDEEKDIGVFVAEIYTLPGDEIVKLRPLWNRSEIFPNITLVEDKNVHWVDVRNDSLFLSGDVLLLYNVSKYYGRTFFVSLKGILKYYEGRSMSKEEIVGGIYGKIPDARILTFSRSMYVGSRDMEIGYNYYWSTIIHELGHYVFGLYDEYRSDTPYWDDLYYEDLGSNSLMGNNYYFLSYRALYEPLWPYTQQYAKRGVSCWEWFVREMEDLRGVLHFSYECRDSMYQPWGSYELPLHDGRKINYDFSKFTIENMNGWLASFEERYNTDTPNYDVTFLMNISIDGI